MPHEPKNCRAEHVHGSIRPVTLARLATSTGIAAGGAATGARDIGTGARVQIPRGMPVLVGGNLGGCTILQDGPDGIALPIFPGDLLADLPDNVFIQTAQGAALGVLVLEAYPPELMDRAQWKSARYLLGGQEGFGTIYNAASGVATVRGISFVPLHGSNVTLMGTVNGACTITLMYSNDGANFREGPSVAMPGAGNYVIDAQPGVPWLAVQTDVNVTLLAELAWRP
jgi:hypothetical protein